MLLRLSVQNFAVLENIELDFSRGMTVFTGESGAGKSKIIEAISYLEGRRASADDIRYGNSGAVIEGVFDFPVNDKLSSMLNSLGIEEDELYIVRREVMASSKSLIKINNQMVTLNNLKQIMALVLSIHSQSSQAEVLQKNEQIEYLDRYIGLGKESIFTEYQQHYQAYQSVKERIEELEYKDRNRLTQLELLKMQHAEISALELKEDEEEELEHELEFLSNYENIHWALSQIKSLLVSEYPPQGMLYDINQSLDTVTKFDESYTSYKDTLMDAYYLLTELNSHVSNDLSSIDYDAERLNAIQSRLNQFNQLKRKFTKTYSGLLQFEQELQEDIDDLENISQSFTRLEEEQKELYEKMEQSAMKLHTYRNERKHFLESKLRRELSELEMPNVQFEISLKESHFNPLGFTDVEFLIATNKGEPLKPMKQIASGGEVSRVSLALRTIFSEFDSDSLIIFDEIDTGVSGQVAARMVEKMKLLSKQRQVLAISHLPQAAATADHLLHVEKDTEGERTHSTAAYLNYEDKIEEIARMISGSKITEAARLNAAELLKSSED
ncbi:DNA repair protein RecN [Jeotgalicoccus nanhaiensis]|uniref:DNA repair protein RecN n=1 Tax=Jeotgalicoccus nanhaiensis TaxID=568603 RepID=A0ABR9XWR5_9STAP|nr:DNA repair protein RecN [Jeotgalicoccus nanhaiensis]MBF0753332.1 DNA repair protein RecN [Jeotgalicoccus nanhaiensis]TFU62498.1 DNA repair protein RecN [Jeotgalicoccus nanhaiensis]